MGRKGNIGSQVVSCRVPTKLFTKLHNEADDKGIAIGVYIRDILSQENFSQGGETKIEYRDKLVPKIEYRDKIVEKIVEVPVEYHHDKIVDNPKLIQENDDLKSQIRLLQTELNKIKQKRKEELEPAHISMARFEVENGTASEKVIQLIKEIDSKKTKNQ